MKDNDLRATVLKLVNDARIAALRMDRRETTTLAVCEMRHETWHGEGKNPHDVDHAQEMMQMARSHHKHMDAVYQLVVGTFLTS